MGAYRVKDGTWSLRRGGRALWVRTGRGRDVVPTSWREGAMGAYGVKDGRWSLRRGGRALWVRTGRGRDVVPTSWREGAMGAYGARTGRGPYVVEGGRDGCVRGQGRDVVPTSWREGAMGAYGARTGRGPYVVEGGRDGCVRGEDGTWALRRGGRARWVRTGRGRDVGPTSWREGAMGAYGARTGRGPYVVEGGRYGCVRGEDGTWALRRGGRALWVRTGRGDVVPTSWREGAMGAYGARTGRGPYVVEGGRDGCVRGEDGTWALRRRGRALWVRTGRGRDVVPTSWREGAMGAYGARTGRGPYVAEGGRYGCVRGEDGTWSLRRGGRALWVRTGRGRDVVPTSRREGGAYLAKTSRIFSVADLGHCTRLRTFTLSTTREPVESSLASAAVARHYIPETPGGGSGVVRIGLE